MFQIVKLLGGVSIINIPGGLTPKGAYDNSTDYAVGDSVDYNGSSYIMYANAAAGNLPTDTDYWQILAEKGDTGADSIVPGPQGPPGADGTGDMNASVYDPTSVAADVFDVDNHVSGTTNKVFTATEQTKLSGIATGATAGATWGVDIGSQPTLGNSAAKDVGTGATNVAAGDHAHTGTYQPAASMAGMPQHLRFTLVDPKGAYAKDHEFCIWAKTDAAITITNIEVTCDANPTTEPTGDLKWADDFLAFTNAAVINDFDTAAGVRSDSSITSGAVAAGKCIYILFDAEPDAALTQIAFDITYDYD